MSPLLFWPRKASEYWAKPWATTQVHRSPQTDYIVHGFRGNTHLRSLPSLKIELWKDEGAFAAWVVSCKALPCEQETRISRS